MLKTETFVRRSMINSSSGSCHDCDTTWQEIGRYIKGRNVGYVKLISNLYDSQLCLEMLLW